MFDLTSYSALGYDPTARYLLLGLGGFILLVVALIVGADVAQHGINSGTLPAIAFVILVGGLLVVFQWRGALVIGARGAVRASLDAEGFELDFPGGRVSRARWAESGWRIVVWDARKGDGPPGQTDLWVSRPGTPDSYVPLDLVEVLISTARQRNLGIETTTTALRGRGTVWKTTIRRPAP